MRSVGPGGDLRSRAGDNRGRSCGLCGGEYAVTAEGQPGDQGLARPHGRKAVHWRRDPAILDRMALVEKRYFERLPNVAIAAELGVSENTVRLDIKRLQELWLERHAQDQDARRAQVLAELADIKVRALAAATFDEMAERAVLFGELPAPGEDGQPVQLHYDDHRRIQFRGNKAAALGVARQAIMDAAKVQGLVIDKVAPVDAQGRSLLRQYIGVA